MATTVVLTDTVDGRLIVDSITPGAYTCAAPAQAISCSLDHIGALATETITVTYHVLAATLPATVSNTATASTDEDGPDTRHRHRRHRGPRRRRRRQGRQLRPGHRRDEPHVHHHRHQQRSLERPGGHPHRRPAGRARTGPLLHRQLAWLQPGLQLDRLGPPRAHEPGEVRYVVITATVDPGTPDGTILSNTATAASPTTDPTPGNNSATETTSVATSADLSISKSGSADGDRRTSGRLRLHDHRPQQRPIEQ